MNQLYLVRHGENKANITKEFSYKLVDYPLNAKGQLQAQQAAASLKGKNIHAIFTSPLKRTYQTAEIIGKALDLKPIVSEAFRELNFGDLEKRPPTKENWIILKNVIQSWIKGKKDASFPNGENYHQLWSRYKQGLIEAARAYPDQDLLIAGHGGIFTFTLLDLCPDVSIENIMQSENHNASITRINLTLVDEQPIGTLVDWANTGHLSGEAAQLVPGAPKEAFLQ
jgi:broad specificity phosphatase PhoE